MEHLRMNGAYWGLTSLDLLQNIAVIEQEEVISWLMSCWDEESGSLLVYFFNCNLFGKLYAIQ